LYKLKQRRLSVSRRKKRAAVQVHLSRKMPWWVIAGGILALLGFSAVAVTRLWNFASR
jgi:hypothetical protein